MIHKINTQKSSSEINMTIDYVLPLNDPFLLFFLSSFQVVEYPHGSVCPFLLSSPITIFLRFSFVNIPSGHWCAGSWICILGAFWLGISPRALNLPWTSAQWGSDKDLEGHGCDCHVQVWGPPKTVDEIFFWARKFTLKYWLHNWLWSQTGCAHRTNSGSTISGCMILSNLLNFSELLFPRL